MKDDSFLPAGEPVFGSKAGSAGADGTTPSEASGKEHAKVGPPFTSIPDSIWHGEIVPMLAANPGLRAVAVYEELMRSHPELGEGVRRSVERRVRAWRLKHGPECEVVFRQKHEPGVLGISDFTDMSRLGVTIAGSTFKHMLYHFRLVYSGFEHAHVVLGGESFVALSQGLQDALRLAGGVPKLHRTDSLSAAFGNMGLPDGEDVTVRYERLCRELGTEPTRNNRGRAHENGSIESSHRHLKDAIEDALLLRGSRDFANLEKYRSFIGLIVSRRNSRNRSRIEAERAVLGPLPEFRSADYEEATVRVTSSGGFRLRKVFYTVPSQYVGHLLHVRIHDDRLEVMAGGRKVLQLPRGRAGKGGRGSHVVNYRHVIHSLRRKPMALLGSVYRDKLFPSDPYRLVFELALARLTAREACRMAVGLLSLAHEFCCERELEAELKACLLRDELPDLEELRVRLRPGAGELPDVAVDLPALSDYDSLTGLTGSAAADREDGDETEK